MSKKHDFEATLRWTGNTGQGNGDFRGYTRDWTLASPGKPAIACSNDPLLGGNSALYNPEDMLIAALSSCHMLWYLHLASDAGIVVHSYEDTPVGHGESLPDGTGRFLSATLRPNIGLAPGINVAAADAIHGRIHAHCFIARSVNFPVSHDARYFEAQAPQ